MTACRRCERCGIRRKVAPWTTPGGLVLGLICEACRRSAERAQRRTERVLEESMRSPVSHRAPVRRKAPVRRSPIAKRIAADLLASPALLALRTRRLEADVSRRYRVKPCTARTAIGIARRYA